MTTTLHRFRPPVADLWLGVGLAVMLVEVGKFAGVAPPYRTGNLPGMAIVAGAALLLVWRRVQPVAVLCATAGLLVLNSWVGYPPQFVQWPVWIALFTCYSLLGWGPRAVAAVVTLLAVLGYALLDRLHVGPSELFWITVCVLVATFTGDLAHSRRATIAAARERSAIEARERAVQAERMVTQERRRLAGELHDALGHAVNVMVMQAGVGRRVFAENPQFAQEALRHIETVGRGALDELDRMLRVLQPIEPTERAEPVEPNQPDQSGEPKEPREPDEPVPADLTGLTGLVEQVRAAGRELQLTTGDVDLSASGARTLHRIVQEAVTNALRHTDAGRIRVDLAQIGDDVRVEVVNEGRDLPVPVAGRGLVNMRERTRLEGGRFEAGPVDGGFRVRAVIPARPGGPGSRPVQRPRRAEP
ncbi:sensor histidine kinase [Micromonospora echinofusca]|uniref:histidine kinase n=1 Tax=Micromonospora echinofusca TaxID=47858 RepID=A0ABS3VK32_MICEH|nr:histidine kinase [Micromonospora echinofusca]MBO4204893.1 histidine kinase [Micromonospora echinofusca]